jgi:hypothetical protein
MFAEYARLLTKNGGEGLLSIDSVTGVLIHLAAGFLLAFIGYKIKGAIGAFVALLLGAGIYLFAIGVIRF